jgi:hypothetical protein
MIMQELHKDVKKDANDRFRYFPAIVMILLMVGFIGATVYVLISSILADYR